MSSPTGYNGITLNGVNLNIATQSPTERRRELKSLLEGGVGGSREHLGWQPAGYPVRSYKRSWEFSWDHVRTYYDTLEEILSAPAPFELCVWKMVHLRYLGDGSRTEFFLPHELGVATDSLDTPPTGQPLADYEPVVKVGLDRTPLNYSAADAGTYATGPSAGTVYFLAGGTQFKLNAANAPDADEFLIVRYVPLYAVLERGDSEKRWSNPIREPRGLSLVER